MSEWAIECEGLTRDFGSKRAVWDLTLRVRRGCVYGLLGRNGCGKTTTIKLLMGLLRPTRGTCRMLGHPSWDMPPDVRGRVGYLIEGHPLYPTWTAARLQRFGRALYARWDDGLFEEILQRFELDPTERFARLSRGQRGMVALAFVVASNPDVFILDDPTMGLDPVVRRTFLETMIQLLQREGRTIVIASHHLADVERVAEYVGVMENGILRVDCPTHEFIQRVRRVELDGIVDATELATVPGLLGLERRDARVILTLANLDDEARARLRALAPAGFEEVPLNLEDAFIAYAGRRPPAPAARERAAAKGA